MALALGGGKWASFQLIAPPVACPDPCEVDEVDDEGSGCFWYCGSHGLSLWERKL